MFNDKLLEDSALDEGVGLNTLGILHCHLETVLTCKHNGCLQTHTQSSHHEIILDGRMYTHTHQASFVCLFALSCCVFHVNKL